MEDQNLEWTEWVGEKDKIRVWVNALSVSKWVMHVNVGGRTMRKNNLRQETPNFFFSHLYLLMPISSLFVCLDYWYVWFDRSIPFSFRNGDQIFWLAARLIPMTTTTRLEVIYISLLLHDTLHGVVLHSRTKWKCIYQCFVELNWFEMSIGWLDSRLNVDVIDWFDWFNSLTVFFGDDFDDWLLRIVIPRVCVNSVPSFYFYFWCTCTFYTFDWRIVIMVLIVYVLQCLCIRFFVFFDRVQMKVLHINTSTANSLSFTIKFLDLIQEEEHYYRYSTCKQYDTHSNTLFQHKVSSYAVMSKNSSHKDAGTQNSFWRWDVIPKSLKCKWQYHAA